MPYVYGLKDKHMKKELRFGIKVTAMVALVLVIMLLAAAGDNWVKSSHEDDSSTWASAQERFLSK